MADTDLLDRLMAALNRNPLLLFKVWSTMRQIGFYGPWKREGQDYVVEDMEGTIVGSIQEEDRFEWEAGSQSGGCLSLAEAQQQVEAALSAEGWRRAPDEICSLTEWVEREKLATPWAEKEPDGDFSPGYWERADRGAGMPLARVYLENAKWKGVVFKPNSATIRYECPPVESFNSCEFAKHAIDVLLYENGLLTFAEITPEPR